MRMMTEAELKEILCDFHTTKTRVGILKSCLDIRYDEDTLEKYDKWSFQVEIIMDAMAILSEVENFVIDTHLVCHHTWVETTKLFSEKYGNNNGKSERTLKRIQSKALRDMLKFISSLPVEIYFNDMQMFVK